MTRPDCVIIDGIRYLPATESVPTPYLQIIAEELMTQFWGSPPEDWEGEAKSLFVVIREEPVDGSESVLNVATQIQQALKNQNERRDS